MTETSLEKIVSDVTLKCGVCKNTLADPELTLIACPTCGAMHHEECAASTGKCSAFGCGGLLEIDESKYLPSTGEIVYELTIKAPIEKTKKLVRDFYEGALIGLCSNGGIGILDSYKTNVEQIKGSPVSNTNLVGLMTEVACEYALVTAMWYSRLSNHHNSTYNLIGISCVLSLGSLFVERIALNKITYLGCNTIRAMSNKYHAAQQKLADPKYQRLKQLKEERLKQKEIEGKSPRLLEEKKE